MKQLGTTPKDEGREFAKEHGGYQFGGNYNYENPYQRGSKSAKDWRDGVDEVIEETTPAEEL